MLRSALLIFLLAVLSGCGGPDTPPPPDPPDGSPTPGLPGGPEPTQPTRLSGTVVGYRGAGGTVLGSMSNSLAEVATGTISAAGAFVLALPAELSDEQVADSDDPANYVFCAGNAVDVSVATWEADLLAAPQVLEAGAVVGTLLYSNLTAFADRPTDLRGLKQVTLVYSSLAFSVMGECADGDVTRVYAMQLEPGWNYVVAEVTSEDAATLNLSIASQVPDGVGWTFVPALGESAHDLDAALSGFVPGRRSGPLGQPVSGCPLL